MGVGVPQFIMFLFETEIQEQHKTLTMFDNVHLQVRMVFSQFVSYHITPPPATSGTTSYLDDRSLIIRLFVKRIILLELKAVATTPASTSPVTFGHVGTPCMSSFDTKSFLLQCNRVWFSSSFFVGTTYLYYRPQRSCGQGYVFTRVCDSVNRGQSASAHAGIPPPTQEADPGIRSMSSRYASYWNAFLLIANKFPPYFFLSNYI